MEMRERKETCCFTGHRPAKLPWGEDESDPRCVRLKQDRMQLLRKSYAAGKRHFICGMAQGADMYFCEAALALREEHPDAPASTAVPDESQAPEASEHNQESAGPSRKGSEQDRDGQTPEQAQDSDAAEQTQDSPFDRSSLLLFGASILVLAAGMIFTLRFRR